MLCPRTACLALPFAVAAALAACSSSESTSNDPAVAPGGGAPGVDGGDGRGSSHDDPAKDPPKDGGASDGRTDAASTDASVPVQTKSAVRLAGSGFACDVLATPSGVLFSTTSEVRLVDDPALGTSTVVATLPSPSGCITIAAMPSTLYLARKAGAQQGELWSAPIGGGGASLVGTFPATTPASTNGTYPIVSDGTDVFVAASPNVWHLPAVGGALTRLMVGQYNFYAQDLAIGPAAIYTFHGGSNDQVSRFPKTGGAYTSKTNVPAQHGAWLLLGDAVFSAVSYPTTVSIYRVSLDFTSSAPFIPTSAVALGTDGTNLYAATVPPTPVGDAIKSMEIGVYAPATGAKLSAFSATAPAPSAPQVTYPVEFRPPLVVDATHVYVRENTGSGIVVIPK